MYMKYPRFLDKERIELSDLNNVSVAYRDVMKEVLKKFLSSTTVIFTGIQVRQTTVPSAQVEITTGYGIFNDGDANAGLLDVAVVQTVNILSGSANPEANIWGDGQSAGDSVRVDLVCIKYATGTASSSSRYFLNDSVSPATEYQDTVDTQITDWFDIVVVRGTAGGSVPATPVGYYKLAEITIDVGAVSILTAKIIDKRGMVPHGMVPHILSSAPHSGHISHSLAVAANDFLVAPGLGAFVKKSLAEVKSILGLGSAASTSSSDYAPAAKGVTNGDSHDHSGGDGGAIDHTALSNKGTNSHATIDAHLQALAPHTLHIVGSVGTTAPLLPPTNCIWVDTN